MNRLEKIRMLKELQAGLITVEDFKPKHFKIDVSPDYKSAMYFINGRPVNDELFSNEIKKASDGDSDYNADVFIDGVSLEERQLTRVNSQGINN